MEVIADVAQRGDLAGWRGSGWEQSWIGDRAGGRRRLDGIERRADPVVRAQVFCTPGLAHSLNREASTLLIARLSITTTAGFFVDARDGLARPAARRGGIVLIHVTLVGGAVGDDVVAGLIGGHTAIRRVELLDDVASVARPRARGSPCPCAPDTRTPFAPMKNWRLFIQRRGDSSAE